ncbi:MAG TPA: proline--tRNA ligase [Spirochaetia bacterium]|nr:proline--tRNA ligase [Spirochaetia bacterium]
MAEKITSRAENYAQWYIDIVLKAQLADYAPVKGCMVIRPRGYALWEKMQSALDSMFKETGHVNAYFPLLIPEGYIKREAEHVEGFAPELAVVTQAGGEELEEPLVIRPTSETIIWSMYKKWIQSYRDLPILINQWANVVRWEKRTRLFLRTTEFLWQEGHTAHASSEEAEEETLKILEVYRRFAEEYMALPVIPGLKSDTERFAGAVRTYAIEAMMQDRKALQSGTSHFLGQNFAKAFDVTYQTQDGKLDYVWASSWGVSTRLIGALIMAHSDDKGLVIPPRLAPTEVVIVPIFRNETKGAVVEYARRFAETVRGKHTFVVDDDDANSPGWKFAEWEMRGVPVRVEIGPRDMESDKVMIVRRDSGEKIPVAFAEGASVIGETLDKIQKSLYDRALEFRRKNTIEVTSYEKMREIFEGEGAFVISPWCGSAECEAKVKEDTKATLRVLPMGSESSAPAGATCIVCGKEALHRAIFAKAY